MNPWATTFAVLAVVAASLAIGTRGVRVSRTASDFYVASRTVGPTVNACAIGGEYLSAASFLGVAGLVLARGADSLWYPVGWTAGYLVLLVLVAAPLRRSGAYTLPDFADLRLESVTARKVSSTLVVAIAVLYLVPQFRGAGLTLHFLTGLPDWVGAVVVSLAVMFVVLAGGMRSITLTQAFQYWLKLSALLVPLFLILPRWLSDRPDVGTVRASDWVQPLLGEHDLYLTYSLVLATFLGTMGLPHVVVRFYTNPDGRRARRTTVGVLVVLGAFYLLPVVYGVLGRLYAVDLVAAGRADSVVLVLPGRVFPGSVGELLTAVLGAGAFAAFLSTSSGLVVSVSGVISQDVIARRLHDVDAFRIGTGVATAISLMLTLASTGISVAHAVELAFAVAASTFCPLLLLGIWWRGLTAAGAIAGMVIGGTLSCSVVVAEMFGMSAAGWPGAVLAQPAAVTVPVAFVTMVAVSLLTHAQVPVHVGRTMVRLHTPEQLRLDRGPYTPERQAPTPGA